MRLLILCVLALASLSLVRPAESAPVPAAAKKPKVEVVFCLDTTGSMGGLIDGAKAKIWAICNQIAGGRPTPDLKVGLVAYRDKGDTYVTKVTDLTDDLDKVHAELKTFVAAGGGDTPEHVNQALYDAVHKIKWSADKKTLKIVFLVGDAPPHMDYANGPKYPELCRAAAKKDLIINTIQCGGIAETTPIWKEIAKMSEGSYAAIAQSGNVAVIATPMDEKLAKLNKRVGETLIPYGDADLRREVAAKQVASESAAAPAAADRLSYNARTNKSVQGAGELLDALASKDLKPEQIEQKKLPADFQKLSRADLEKRIAKTRDERTELQKEIADLSQKRSDYLAKETKRLAASGKGDSFDENVAQIIRKEAARKGIHY